jgi:hypothetical protein
MSPADADAIGIADADVEAIGVADADPDAVGVAFDLFLSSHPSHPTNATARTRARDFTVARRTTTSSAKAAGLSTHFGAEATLSTLSMTVTHDSNSGRNDAA